MKTIRFLILSALALPAVVAAQQPTPTQPPVNPITTAFKNAGARNARLLMAAFDSIPAAKYGYKPMPVQQSIGYIAQHLESANYQLCGLFGAVKPTMTAKDSLADTVKANWPKDTLTARLKASFAFCDAAVATVDDGKLAELIVLPSMPNAPAGAPPRTVVRAQYVLVYVTDLVDHYSQIANYMRLNGMIPPSALPRPGRGGN